MAKTRKVEPLQAVVDDTTGLVDNVIVCDQATADLFNDMDPAPFPGATLIECGGLGVGVGWTYTEDRTPRFRPQQPGPDWTWDDSDSSWAAPPLPPESDPEPEPGPTSEQDIETSAATGDGQ